MDMSKNTYRDHAPLPDSIPIPQLITSNYRPITYSNNITVPTSLHDTSDNPPSTSSSDTLKTVPPMDTPTISIDIPPLSEEWHDVEEEQRRSARIARLPTIDYTKPYANANSATSDTMPYTPAIFINDASTKPNNNRPISDGIKANRTLLDEKTFYPHIDQAVKDLNQFKTSNRSPASSKYSPAIMVKPQKKKGIHSQSSAMKYDWELAARAVDVEMKKLDRYGVAVTYDYKDLKPDDVVMYSFFLFKLKLNASTGNTTKMTARLAVNGKNQPPHTYSNTFAATADQNKVTLGRVAFIADAIKQGRAQEVYMKDLDICGAFLHANYESKLGTRLFMWLPKDLPGLELGSLHPMAGKLVKLEKALYGLPEANMLFERQRNIAIEKSGFKPIESDGSIFIMREGDHHSVLFVHVDDFQIISNCPEHWDRLVHHLKERFRELDINEVSEQHVGITCEFSKVDPSAFRLGQSGYINKIIDKLEVPFSASVPSNLSLFSDTTDTAPYEDINYYQKLIGTLIYALATRADIRKEVIFLASKSSAPTIGDMVKLTKVFAYLKQTPTLGPIFDSKEGAVLYAYADAAFNNHPGCTSHGGSFLCIGKSSAAIASHSREITSCVALSSMEAEYVTLCETARVVVYMRRFLSDIGFPQLKPTIIFEDNSSAISLASCSNIPKKSRHILLRYHFIKYAVESGQVEVHYIDTKKQRADFLTKVLSRPDFIKGRDDILNLTNQHVLFPTN